MDGGILSQDEINALLNGMDMSSSDSVDDSSSNADQSLLTDIEKDAIGEVANISMGTSATTLYALVNRRVDITTPKVELSTWDSLISESVKPCVCIRIKYKQGLDGSNILILQEKDVKIISDLMMGGDGSGGSDEPLSEIHLSAISEAMNQMMGSSATSLSSMLGKKIDISPPMASVIELDEVKDKEDLSTFIEGTFVKISFRIQIGDLIDSSILQIYPIDFAKELCNIFMDNGIDEKLNNLNDASSVSNSPSNQISGMPPFDASMAQPFQAPPVQPFQAPPAGYQMPPYGYGNMPINNVNVQPAQFQAFNQQNVSAGTPENINLIMDVPLEVTVELGRTKKSIADILDFAPGTIIELDKIAGEPIDVLVNGKFVAKGEVVVIEESFGIRVTEIIN